MTELEVAVHTTISEEQICSVLREILEILPNTGQKYIYWTCCQCNIFVQRQRIRDAINTVDPVSSGKVNFYNALKEQCSSTKLIMANDVLQRFTMLSEKILFWFSDNSTTETYDFAPKLWMIKSSSQSYFQVWLAFFTYIYIYIYIYILRSSRSLSLPPH